MRVPHLSAFLGRGLITAVLVAAGRLPAAAADAEPPAPRFSVANMDLTVDPRVDFARYAAGTWYKTTRDPRRQIELGQLQPAG